MLVEYENYTALLGFMRKGLNLKGNELIVYAVIYGHSQAEGQCYNKDLEYLADWCGISTRAIMNILKDLTERGLIERIDANPGGFVKTIHYRVKIFRCEKSSHGGEKSSHGEAPITKTDVTTDKTVNYNNIIEFTDMNSYYDRQKLISDNNNNSNHSAENKTLDVNYEFDNQYKHSSENNISAITNIKDYSSHSFLECEYNLKERGVGETHHQTLPFEDIFEQFWAAYPRKVNKKGSYSSFKRIVGLRKIFPDIMSALEKQKRSEQWSRPEFIPHPQTWLNQERWKDTTDEIKPDIEKQIDEAWNGQN